MLPLDLIRELVSLLDDSTTFHTFALASKLTSRICDEQMVGAKNKYIVLDNEAYTLPNGTLHGPKLSCGSHLATLSFYVDGKKEGHKTQWDDRIDQKIQHVTYRNGLKVSLPSERRLLTFLKEGIRRIWFFSGMLYSKTSYHQGVREGHATRWWSNGRTREEINYHEGELDGKYEEWYYDGILQQSSTYRHGKIAWEMYHVEG